MQSILDFFKYYKDFFDSLQSIATILALVLGGYWTWWVFIRKRGKYPRVEVSHQIAHRLVTPGKVLLQVRINIKNTGEALIQIKSWFIWVQQMKPCAPELLEVLAQDQDPIETGQNQVNWPLLHERIFDSDKAYREIEPGVQDQIYVEFLLDIAVQTIMVYTYFDEPVKPYPMGWETTSVYDLA